MEEDQRTFEIVTMAPPVEEKLKMSERALGALCFSEQRTEDEQKEHDDRFCSQRDYYKFVFAVQDDQVIGSVTILKRSIPFQNNEIVLAGLGGVCTHPDKRQQGIASELLKLAMQEIQKSDADIAYLATDVKNPIKLKLYEKVGFKSFQHGRTFLGKSGKRYFGKYAMISPIHSSEIFQKIMKSGVPFDIGTGDW